MMLIAFTLLIFVKLSATQYYQGSNYNQMNQYGQSQQYNANEIEKKFVNSGQSVMLVCDLPNNMPDGKVRVFISYGSIFQFPRHVHRRENYLIYL